MSEREIYNMYKDVIDSYKNDDLSISIIFEYLSELYKLVRDSLHEINVMIDDIELRINKTELINVINHLVEYTIQSKCIDDNRKNILYKLYINTEKYMTDNEIKYFIENLKSYLSSVQSKVITLFKNDFKLANDSDIIKMIKSMVDSLNIKKKNEFYIDHVSHTITRIEFVEYLIEILKIDTINNLLCNVEHYETYLNELINAKINNDITLIRSGNIFSKELNKMYMSLTAKELGKISKNIFDIVGKEYLVNVTKESIIIDLFKMSFLMFEMDVSIIYYNGNIIINTNENIENFVIKYDIIDSDLPYILLILIEKLIESANIVLERYYVKKYTKTNLQLIFDKMIEITMDKFLNDERIKYNEYTHKVLLKR
jgi:hypothetical protein